VKTHARNHDTSEISTFYMGVDDNRGRGYEREREKNENEKYVYVYLELG